MSNDHILVVGDEQRLAENLQIQLHQSGFRDNIANDGYVGKHFEPALIHAKFEFGFYCSEDGL